MGKWLHRLTDIDPVARTATCAHCGPTALYGKDRSRYRCYIKRREEKATDRRKPRGGTTRTEAQRQSRREYEARPERRAAAAASRERYRAKKVGGRADDPESRLRWRVAKYAITVEEYRAMEAEQGACCKICRRAAPLVIDHCHETGRVRGLLCKRCNTGLGVLGDQHAALLAAATYLAG